MHRVTWRAGRGARRTQADRSAVMSRRAGKALVPLLSVLVALAMGVAGVAIYLQMQERDRRQAKERELHLALTENDDLKARLKEIEQAKARAEEDLTRTRQEVTRVQDELAKASQERDSLARSVEDRQREIDRLAKDLQQSQDDAKQASAKLAELQTERDAAKQQLTDLERAKGELETKVMELSGQPTVQLDKVLVTNQGAIPAGGVVMPASATAPITDGQVVVINREYDFIVMNLGKNQGLTVGQEFQVVRGDEVLGKVKVEKVYDELSAAAILPDSRKDQIREGDTVKAI